MLGDVTAPEPASKRTSEANVSEEKSEALGLPNKGALCKCGHITATATTELEQSWPGFPQSRSLVLHTPVVFPARGLSLPSCRESQAVLARGLLVARSGGPPRLPRKRAAPGVGVGALSKGRGGGSRQE